ncbi:ABC transporter ATP-binding protein [Mesorhizobium sp. M7A.F.Ca.MR.228.00.0.0]|nr:ABC transporter ATP-binding protein [Mesorhizobium sp. M7A.F.Ca.MR.228.00.0.0]
MTEAKSEALTISGLDCYYGEVQVLYGLDLVLNKGEVLCLFGRNGAGKTTTLKAIMGLVPSSAGSIKLAGQELTGLPAHEVPKAGVAYVPQGRRLFAEMTVAENIEIGLMARGKGKATRENVLDLFPLLRQRLRQRSGTLSGGEQQMLAMARALMGKPRMILLDEPSLGLAPQLIDTVFDLIAELRRKGLTILLVEQNVALALEIADRAVVLANGEVVLSGTAKELASSDLVRQAYLGA